MAVKKSQKSLLETTLITIVRFGLNVGATLSTTVNSIKKRRKKPERKAERKAVDRKPENSLEKYKLEFEDVPDTKKKLKRRTKK